MWAKAATGPSAAIIPCIEWAVFVSTHAISEGSATWKSANGGVFGGAPPLVRSLLTALVSRPPGLLPVPPDRIT